VLSAVDRFPTFGPVHLAIIGVFLAGAVGLVAFGRARHGTEPARRVSRLFAVAIPCVTVPSQAFQLAPGNFSLGSSLPLQLCDLAWVAATWALWTHHRVPVALTYFWGLTLTVQGIITPSLEEAFPEPGFLAFWALHLLIVWAAIYLTLGLGIGPRWREYRVTVAVTAVWAVLVFAFNTVFGVNYGYLNRKPSSASLLDLLGPWPVYVLAALGLLLAGWALLTWPWVLVGRRRDRREAPAG
jgi:hypothetical integral membrane protein (TIGR02206 family)